jgi:ATP-dependent RNA helicase RhlB
MELAYEFMNDPERVTVTPEQVTAVNVEHHVLHVGNDEKLGMMLGVLRREAGSRTLVFTNMKRTAEDLVENLRANGFEAGAITGDIDQRRRLALLADFKEGRLPMLIATDVASRGLHIGGVTHVINYDLPQDPEDYVHRIGRTARAGASGKAISLVCEDYAESLEAIERYIGFKLPYEIPDHELFVPPTYVRRRRAHGARGRDRAARGHGERRRGHAAPPPDAGGTACAPPREGAPRRRRRRGRRSPAHADSP